MPEYLIFLLMVVIFIFLAMVFKLPIGLSLALSAAAGSLLGGKGISLRHLVEGSFGYFDTILIIVTATVFIKALQASGILDAITAILLKSFYKRKLLFLFTIMLLIMFPAMITGSSTTAVLSSGALVAPVLMKLGLPRLKTAALITMGSILGMIAPPVNILVMIIGGGVDMPYVGITWPLLIIVIPAAVATTLWLAARQVRPIGYEQMISILPQSLPKKYRFRLHLPLATVLVLMVSPGLSAGIIPDIGIPAIFLLASLVGLVSGRPFNIFKITQKAIGECLPVLGILAGVGMFVQVMTVTGARGWAVVSILSLPSALLYFGISLSMPLFGGISSFGSASILGVPFTLAFIERNAVFTSSALSAIASLGDIMLPSAIACRFSAQVVGEPNFFRVMRHCFVPALFQLAMGLGVLFFAPSLDKIF